MSAEIISLRQARKRRARDAKTALAAENRVRFGRTREERLRDAQAEQRAQKHVDAHFRESEAPSAPAQDKPAVKTQSAPNRPKTP